MSGSLQLHLHLSNHPCLHFKPAARRASNPSHLPSAKPVNALPGVPQTADVHATSAHPAPQAATLKLPPQGQASLRSIPNSYADVPAPQRLVAVVGRSQSCQQMPTHLLSCAINGHLWTHRYFSNSAMQKCASQLQQRAPRLSSLLHLSRPQTSKLSGSFG